jgi:hypothetical protein
MLSYTLNIAFEKEDVRKINQIGERVILIKQTNPASSQNQVAWVAFDPFENNVVNWNEIYYVYASTNELQSGARIKKASYEDAGNGSVYNFKNNVFSLDPNLLVDPDTFGIYNATGNDLSFGLAQNVTVNNSFFTAAPINATTVLAGQNVNFTPLTQVSVFLQKNTTDGLVLAKVFSNNYLAMFGNGLNEISVIYRNGNFIKV